MTTPFGIALTRVQHDAPGTGLFQPEELALMVALQLCALRSKELGLDGASWKVKAAPLAQGALRSST